MKKKLEALKDRLGMSWGELAAYIGISRSMLDFLRNGSRVPGNKTRRLIEEAYARGLSISPTSIPKKGDLDVGNIGSDDLPTLMVRAVIALERIATALERLQARQVDS